MKKRKLALVLTLIMSIGLFSGCQNSKVDATQTQSAMQDVQTTENNDDEDMAEINILYIHTGGATKYDGVEAALNELAEEKINTHVNVEILGFGDYMQNTVM